MSNADPHSHQRDTLIRAFHESSTELVLALSGGGSLVLGDLLTVPGASQTLIEATVPYSKESLSQYIGRVPEQYCCQRTARYMAMTAFHRGLRHIQARNAAAKQLLTRPILPRPKARSVDVSHDLDDARLYVDYHADRDSATEGDLSNFSYLIGVGCTASLATNRTKKGECRIHVAVQTLGRTIAFSLQLTKDARTRKEEERLVADLILNAVEAARNAIHEQEQTLESMPPELLNLPTSGQPFPFAVSGQSISIEFAMSYWRIDKKSGYERARYMHGINR